MNFIYFLPLIIIGILLLLVHGNQLEGYSLEDNNEVMANATDMLYKSFNTSNLTHPYRTENFTISHYINNTLQTALQAAFVQVMSMARLVTDFSLKNIPGSTYLSLFKILGGVLFLWVFIYMTKPWAMLYVILDELCEKKKWKVNRAALAFLALSIICFLGSFMLWTGRFIF